MGSLIRFVMIVMCGLWLVQTPAYAALDLTLTQGVSSALPIAVVPFAGQDNSAADNVASVIMTDLQNSGRFKVMDPQTMAQTPHAVNNVDYNYWRRAGNNNVVIGNVRALGGNQYRVNFALLDVFKGQQQESDQVLAQQTFTVSGNKLRGLAHHISDTIYQQLTGVRGVFSTRIAYVVVQRNPRQPAKFILAVADADGYNPRPLLTSRQPIMSPAWSRDGTRVAYVSFENVTPRIYIQNVSTGSRRIITSFPGINGAPAWSPDDNRLALVLSKAGSPKIFILNLANGQLQQITHGNSIDTEPSWSPDGSSLIFTSDRGGGPQIYTMNLATGDVQRLTFNGGYNARASFSADGKNIVMIHRTQDMYDIAMQNLADGTVQVLTQSGYDASPSLAPNGQMVLYESGAGTQGVLGMVSADARVKLRLPAAEGSVQDPAWSPFLS